jgi:hypothetical protein
MLNGVEPIVMLSAKVMALEFHVADGQNFG